MTMLFTIGHGTQRQDALTALLHESGITALVDVRISPSSRRHPHVDEAELARWLPAAGIGYRSDLRLGGHRAPPPNSPDVALRNRSFRGYAAHMRTGEFGAALAELIAEAAGQRTAIMCSESVWWRCHRRLIADHLVLVDVVAVQHVMPDGRLAEHRPTDGVRVGSRELIYDVDGERVD